MRRYTPPLGLIKVAAPCSANWDDMIGTERARFCGQCQLNVYNLSDMTRREAEDLISRSEGHLCVRFYRRADGTILTNNCPVGLRAIKRRVSQAANAVLSTVLSFFGGLGLYTALSESAPESHTMGAISVTTRQEPAVGQVAVTSQTHRDEPSDGWTTGTMAYTPIMGAPEMPEPTQKIVGKRARHR